jgi:lysozyme
VKISEKGLELLKHYEGCELTAYRCSANVLTIGYGHTKGVTEDMVITQEEADQMLHDEMPEYEGYINDKVTVELNQDQFDAMVCWVYNLGSGNLSSSTLLKVLNDGDYDGVPEQMKRWNKAGGKVLNGLIKRRDSEAKLFCSEEWL